MSDGGRYIAPAARLPDDTPSFAWMITDSIHTVASRETPYRESARLFGDRYGLVLALTDAFRDDDARGPELRRGFEVARGVLAHAKKHLHDAWDARARPVIEREMDDLIERATPRPGTARPVATKTPATAPDPFAGTAKVIDRIDREPDRSKAAVELAIQWAILRNMPLRLRELREEASAADRELLDGLIRSAGRWLLDLEESWSARTFDELLGRPTIGELLKLVFPAPEPSPD
jgi:hypothetical protein